MILGMYTHKYHLRNKTDTCGWSCVLQLDKLLLIFYNKECGEEGGGKSYYSLSYAPIPINMAVLIKGKLSQVFYFHNITPRWKQENYAALQTAFSHKHWGKSVWAHKHSEEHCLQQWYPYTPRSMGRHTYYLLHWDNADAIYLAGNAEAFTENWQKRKTQRIQTR